MEHLSGLPADFAALSDCELVSAGGATFPVHSAVLARWSGVARSLLAAIRDEVASANGQGELAAALSAPLADCAFPAGEEAAALTAFLKLLYALPSRKMLADALCAVQHDAGELPAAQGSS